MYRHYPNPDADYMHYGIPKLHDVWMPDYVPYRAANAMAFPDFYRHGATGTRPTYYDAHRSAYSPQRPLWFQPDISPKSNPWGSAGAMRVPMDSYVREHGHFPTQKERNIDSIPVSEIYPHLQSELYPDMPRHAPRDHEIVYLIPTGHHQQKRKPAAFGKGAADYEDAGTCEHPRPELCPLKPKEAFRPALMSTQLSPAPRDFHPTAEDELCRGSARQPLHIPVFSNPQNPSQQPQLVTTRTAPATNTQRDLLNNTPRPSVDAGHVQLNASADAAAAAPSQDLQETRSYVSSTSSHRSRTMTRSEAARHIQKAWRGWCMRRHRVVFTALIDASKAYRRAAATFYQYVTDTNSHILHKQMLEVTELAMRVLLSLDAMTAMPVAAWREAKRNLTRKVLGLQDRVQLAWEGSRHNPAASPPVPGLPSTPSGKTQAAVEEGTAEDGDKAPADVGGDAAQSAVPLEEAESQHTSSEYGLQGAPVQSAVLSHDAAQDGPLTVDVMPAPEEPTQVQDLHPSSTQEDSHASHPTTPGEALVCQVNSTVEEPLASCSVLPTRVPICPEEVQQVVFELAPAAAAAAATKGEELEGFAGAELDEASCGSPSVNTGPSDGSVRCCNGATGLTESSLPSCTTPDATAAAGMRACTKGDAQAHVGLQGPVAVGALPCQCALHDQLVQMVLRVDGYHREMVDNGCQTDS